MRPPPPPIAWDDPGDDDVVGAKKPRGHHRGPTAPRWLVCVVIAIFAAMCIQMGPYGLWLALAVALIAGGRKLDDSLAQRRERQRLLEDCHAEHEAWKRGDDAIAFHGRFRPDGHTYDDSAIAAAVYQVARRLNCVGPWTTP